MKLRNNNIHLSATDLANHLGCHHLTELNRAVATGAREVPSWHDPLLAILAERGELHERAYLDHLRQSGLEIVAIEETSTPSAIDQTVDIMRTGTDIIYQAPLQNDYWHGRADFLRKVSAPSDLGEWSYEVIDAKLAAETRAGTILQLCIYCEIVGQLQGRVPEYMYVASPRSLSKLTPFRFDDFSAYHRLIKRKLHKFLEKTDSNQQPSTYPELVSQCEVCRWWPVCDKRRRSDDNLCFVAGIHKSQIAELKIHGVDTLQKLGELEEIDSPRRGSPESLVRVRDQARIQVLGRDAETPKYELLGPIDQEHGLALLPEPTKGDIFLDLEGDHFAPDGGREYLFGYVIEDSMGQELHGYMGLEPI